MRVASFIELALIPVRGICQEFVAHCKEVNESENRTTFDAVAQQITSE